jgi:hypothetical protein
MDEMTHLRVANGERIIEHVSILHAKLRCRIRSSGIAALRFQTVIVGMMRAVHPDVSSLVGSCEKTRGSGATSATRTHPLSSRTQARTAHGERS